SRRVTRSTAAGRGGGARPAVSQPEAAPSPPAQEPVAAPVLSREEQVQHVYQLLVQKGEEAGAEVRQRVAANKGVVARGLYFDADVLGEALELWQPRE
ncbi:unnamed protein product, partial [Polarella glacialis]